MTTKTIGALCCVCGTAREACRGAFTVSGNRRLKCATCGATTMHALVFGRDIYDDWRERANLKHENRDHVYDKAGTQPQIVH